MENKPRKGKLWHRIKYRNSVAPSVEPLSNDNVRHFDVELKRRQRVMFYMNKIVNRTKSEERSAKIAPLIHTAPGDNDIQEYCRICPSTAMSQFQERDILKKVDARGLESKHPILLNTIINEAKEEYLKITQLSGTEMKLKIEKQFTVQPYKHLGRTKNYAVFLQRRKELKRRFILHFPLIRRILTECVRKLPYELFNLHVSLKCQLNVKEFEKHIFDYANDAVQRLQEFYRSIVALVEHEKVNTLRARSYLGACTGLLSVNISRAIAHTLLHVVSFTGSKEHVPYLKLNIMFKDRLVLEPTADDIIEIYNKFLKKIIDSTKLFHVLEKYTIRGFETKHIYLCLTDEFFQSVVDNISFNIREKYAPIVEFIKRLDDEFKDIYADLNFEDGAYFSSDLIFEDGCRKLLYFKSYLSKVAFVPDNAYFTIGQLTITDYKTILKQSLLHIIENIFNNLSLQHQWENSDICEAFDIIYVRATQKPITTEELIEIGKYLAWVKAEYLDELKERVVKALDYLTKLIQLGSLKESHIILNAKAINWLDKVMPVLEENTLVFEQLKFEAEEKLQRVIEDINVDIKQVYPLLDILNSMDDIGRVQAYLNTITLHMVKIKQIEDKVNWINQEEVSLSFPMSSYSEFDDLKNYVYPFYHLLKLCLEVKRNLSVWLDGQFDLINYGSVTEIVQKHHKELLTTQKLYRSKLRQAQDENLSLRFKGTVDDPDMLNWPAPLKLCSEAIKLIQDFEPFLMVIKIMCNGALMKRHWEKMSKVAGFDMTPNAGTTLRKISEVDLKNNIDKYELISSSATKERELLEDLKEMQQQWNHVYFTTELHQQVKVIVRFDNIEAVTDNHVIKIITMLNSVYVKPYRDEVKAFHANLSKITTTIDEFRQTQQQLLRFHPLFLCNEMEMVEESSIFAQISTVYDNYIAKISTESNVFFTVNNTNILHDFRFCNQQFELINHGVSNYFNNIRCKFLRFHFICDEEMFQILSSAKNPADISIRSLFPNIMKLDFDNSKRINNVISEHDELLPVSVSGTEVAPELWLKDLDEQIKHTIGAMIRESFNNRKQNSWILNWPGQILIAVTRIMFTNKMHDAINNSTLMDCQKEIHNHLEDTVDLLRSSTLNITSAMNLQSLVVLMIKNKEIATNLVNSKIVNEHDFKWLSQTRYYLTDDERVLVKVLDSCMIYGNEYLGKVKQIVETPDTEKCYHRLILAFKYYLCGVLYGDANSGKTATIKSLSQIFAVQCIFFNCFKNVELCDITRLIKGVASSGAWLVLENFNNISVDICSVMTQELSKLSDALKSRQIGLTELKLQKYFICCTMNDFRQLDNTFKTAFRPVFVHTPDWKIITQVYLCSFGYDNWKKLAEKIVTLHTLMQDLLPAKKIQFGIRSLIELLTKCGKSYGQNEQDFVYNTICQITIPKLSVAEREIFEHVTTEIFPNCQQTARTLSLRTEINELCKNVNLESSDEFVDKVNELYEILRSNSGVIVVGETYTGKSVLIKIVHEIMKQHHLVRFNPSMFNVEQIFGKLHWNDGLVTSHFRKLSSRELIVFDGPLDPQWVDYLTAATAEDNPKVYLSSGEVIHLNKTTRIVFETDNIDNASPSMVSRCSVIYMDPQIIGWKPILSSWLRLVDHEWKNDYQDNITVLFHWIVPPSLNFVKKHCRMLCEINDTSLVKTTIRVFEMILVNAYGLILRKEEDAKNISSWIQASFIQAVIWGLGSNLNIESRQKFDEFFKQLWRGQNESHPYPSGLEKIEINVPVEEIIFDYTYLFKSKGTWKYWPDALKNEKFAESDYLTEMFVPTNETLKYTAMVNMHINHNYPVLLVGPPGTGKTSCMLDILISKLDKHKYESTFITFTPHVSAYQVQQMIMSKLYKKKSGCYGPSKGKLGVFYIDDFSEPSRNKLNNQPIVELMRELLSRRQLLSFENFQPVSIDNVNILASMTSSFGEKQNQRLLRHFNVFSINELKDDSISRIYTNILFTNLKKLGFPSDIIGTVNQIVSSTFHFYNNVLNLKPNVGWNFYYFNIRNFRRVIQSCCMIRKESADSNKKMFLKLWAHEIIRGLGDRLLEKDLEWLVNNLKLCIRDYFKEDYECLFENLRIDENTEPNINKLLFTTVCDKTLDRFDETDFDKFADIFATFIKDYNNENANKIDLILFEFALQYLAKISRILALTCCNLIQVGMCGTGRQSLVKLACLVYNQKYFHLEMKEQFNLADWHKVVKMFLREAGGYGRHCTFFLKEEQIIDENIFINLDYLLKTGQIPFLYTLEEKQTILDVVRTNLQEQDLKIEHDSESIFLYYQKRCQEYLHIIFSFNITNSIFRKYLRTYPHLTKYCEIILLKSWPKESQDNIARVWMQGLQLTDEQKAKIIQSSTHFYNEVEMFSKTVTTGSYLHFLRLYVELINFKQNKIIGIKQKYLCALEKLAFASLQISEMQKALADYQPQLEAMTVQAVEMAKQIETETNEVEKASDLVKKDEETANEQAAAAQILKLDCEADLAQAIPILEDAISALNTLKPTDITLVKSMKNPPDAIKLVMAAVCVIKDVKPDRIPDPSTGRKTIDYWGPSKRILGDMNFLQTLKDFDKDNIKPEIMVKIRKDYLPHKDFKPHTVAKASSAAEGLCKWIIAMDMYDKVAKEVAPKKEKLEKAEREYAATMAILNEKKEQVARIEQKLADLNTMLKEATRKQQKLQRDVDVCKNKLNRAQKLIGGLSEERERWTSAVSELKKQYNFLPGDILLSSALISYTGQLRLEDRRSLLSLFVRYVNDNNIPVKRNYTLVEAFEKDVDLDEWNLNGLPRDTFLVENGIIGKFSKRWSLYIDPQKQASEWIKIIEKPNGLKATKFTCPNYLTLLKECVIYGKPVLIENVDEPLKPFLMDLITRSIYIQDEKEYIKIDNEMIAFNANFVLYITTNVKSPNYGFEIYDKLTVLDFGMTRKSVQDHLLTCVVEVEKPTLKKIKDSLYIGQKQNKDTLNSIEEKILKILSESKTDILEDECALQVLDESKVLSRKIEEKQKSLLETGLILEKYRNDYEIVAKRSVSLYFTVFQLSKINHMYQFSYEWFVETYCESVGKAAQFKQLSKRLDSLIDTITYEIYTKITKSLFEKDKLLFSFLLCTNLLSAAGKIKSEEMQIFAQFWQTPESLSVGRGKHWDDIFSDLKNSLITFSETLIENESKFRLIYDSKSPEMEIFPEPFDKSLLKLLAISRLRPDRLYKSIRNFVKSEMSDKFVKFSVFDIATSFSDSHILSPIIVLMKPGSDSINAIRQFASTKHFENKFITTSIVEAAENGFEDLLEKSKQLGLWICLENCHLRPNFLPCLDLKIEEIDYSNTHENFRFWFTSNECQEFPLSLLEKSVKIANQCPQGFRNKLIDLVSSYPISSPEFYYNCPGKQDIFVPLLYATSFLHCLLLERHNFRFHGWNAPYIFNKNDVFIALNELQSIVNNRCRSDEEITYVISECVYGAQVTNKYDNGLLNILVKDCLNPSSGRNDTISNIPPSRTDYHNFMSHILELPDTSNCEIFGLHENYNSVADSKESQLIQESIRTIFNIKTDENVADVSTIIDELLEKFPPDKEVCHKKKSDDFVVNLIVLRDVQTYTKLLNLIRGSLKNVRDLLHFKIINSDDLEDLRNCIVTNRIPKIWGHSATNSNCLSHYVQDVIAKYDYLNNFFYNSEQEVWLGCFLRTKALLTAIKLVYSRQYGVSYDKILFRLRKIDGNSHTGFNLITIGLYLTGACWNNSRGVLEELLPKILHDSLPPVLFTFAINDTNQTYECPLYKSIDTFETQTDYNMKNSSNFVSSVLIDSENSEHWTRRKVNLLCELQ